MEVVHESIALHHLGYQSKFRHCISTVRCIKDKPAVFAKVLHKSMKGLGTDDESLLRVIISRCEVDMVQIKDAFQREYKQTLGQFIAVSTSHAVTSAGTKLSII